MDSAFPSRDLFPKRGLDNSYVGDRYPLCADLPKHSFLRIGAKYRLLGGSSEPKWQYNYHPNDFTSGDALKRIVLRPFSSKLYEKLCNASTDGVCDFASIVTLDTNLPCDGTECNIDVIRVVQVAPGVFYEHLRQPCVHQAFFDNGKKVVAGRIKELAMCANPKLPIASESCCFVLPKYPIFGSSACEYKGEVVTFNCASQRCQGLGGSLCGEYFSI